MSEKREMGLRWVVSGLAEALLPLTDRVKSASSQPAEAPSGCAAPGAGKAWLKHSF